MIRCVCADFAAFIGPLPRMNRLGNLSDLPSNPTGLTITLIMLGLVIVILAFGIYEYRGTLRASEATSTNDLAQQGRRDRYEADVTHFAEFQRRYKDKSLPYVYRACMGLRTRWLLGGSL